MTNKNLCAQSLRTAGILSILLTCGTLWAQNAVVSGRVTDTSGGVIPNASVELINRATQVKSPTVTNAEGIYIFPSVSPGVYAITAGIMGFSNSRVDSVTLEVGQSRTINLELKPGDVSQSVSVNDEAPLITTDRGDRGTVVENQFVTSIPLATRNPLLLLTLSAGVVPGSRSDYGDNTTSQSATNVFRINGGRTTTNEILIDGASNTGTYNNQASAIPQVDAVQEFRVNTNPYDAELGHTGGGIVSYTIKSGTNDLHGNLHEFLQNQILNADGFNANKAGQARQKMQKNQFGFTVGGPVKIPKLYNGKNKTFFFFGYEGLRQNSFSSFTGTVPTAAEIGGDFSHTYDTNGVLKKIYNPYTTRLDPNAPAGTTRYIRDVFSGNAIPSTLLNPVGINLLKYYPAANQAGIGASDSNNFFSSASNTLTGDRIDARIDHQFSDKHAVFARGDWFSNLNSNPMVYGNKMSPVQTPNTIPGENWIVSHTWTISPSVILVHHFSEADSQTNRVPTTMGFDQTSLGLPSSVTTGQVAAYFPSVSVGGYSGIGAVGTVDNVVISRTYQYGAALTVLKSAHTIKTGVDYRYYTLMWENPSPLYITGGGGFTAGSNPLSATSNTGSGLADLLLGAASVSYNINPTFHNNHPYYAGFVQDEWRATKDLTLTFGVRYNLELGSIEKSNRYVYLDTASTSPLVVPGYNLRGGLGFTGVNGVGRRALKADTNNWDPRIGAAYRINNKTSLRAGFGIFHHPQLSTSNDVSQGFTRNTSNITSAADTVTPTFNLSNPFPSGLLQPTGNSLGLATQLGQGISGPLRDQRIAYQSQWSVDIERQLPYAIMLGIGYTGTSAAALPYSAVLNQLTRDQLALGSQLTKTVSNPFYGYITDSTSTLSRSTVQYAQLLRPYPQFTSVNQTVAPYGHSSYHAMELKVERRFAQGLAILFNWTRSKAIDNVGEISGFAGLSSSFTDSYCYSCDKSLSYLDVPDYVNLSVRYELPFGTGKKMINHGVLARVLGNWSVAGVYTYSSGLPVSVTSPNNSNSFNGGSSRPNATGVSAALHGGPKLTDNGQYFNAAAFSQTPEFAFGNVSRYLSDVRNPSNKGINALIEKQWALYERIKMELRGELFNATNSVVFSGPQTSITSSAFGTISLSQANTPRVVQFGLRVAF